MIKITEEHRRIYGEIINNIHYGNWNDAVELAVDNNFDATIFVELNEVTELYTPHILPIRDIALLSMYTERLRYERKERDKE